MHAFKFLSSRYADDLVGRGVLRIGCASEFREPDGITGARQDEYEALFTWIPNERRSIIRRDHPFIQRLFGGDPPWPEGQEHVEFIFDEGVRLVDHAFASAYLYCMSRDITPTLPMVMQQRFGADACVEILDVQEFSKILKRHPNLRNLHYCLGPVEYLKNYSKPLRVGAFPFLYKLEAYAWQREVRIVFPSPRREAEAFVAELPNLCRYVRRVY